MPAFFTAEDPCPGRQIETDMKQYVLVACHKITSEWDVEQRGANMLTSSPWSFWMEALRAILRFESLTYSLATSQ